MAFISYVSERQVPAAHRAGDPDRILQNHRIHPRVMRQHADPFVELMHRPSPRHASSER